MLLTLQGQQFLQHLIRSLDCLAVGLETPLGNDHIRELLCKVNIAHFQSTGNDFALTRHTGGSDKGLTGVDGLNKGRLTYLSRPPGLVNVAMAT